MHTRGSGNQPPTTATSNTKILGKSCHATEQQHPAGLIPRNQPLYAHTRACARASLLVGWRGRRTVTDASSRELKSIINIFRSIFPSQCNFKTFQPRTLRELFQYVELLYRYIIHELHSTLKIYTLEKKRERGGGSAPSRSSGINWNHNIYTWKDGRLFHPGESNTFIPPPRLIVRL